ncbi:unnamed protein product, partial [Symbiodinium microadriaticum]
PDTLSLPFIPKGASHQAFSPDVSPVGTNMLLNKRSRSFQGLPSDSTDATKAPSPLKKEEPADSSPMGTALRAIRRAGAFGGAEKAQAASARAAVRFGAAGDEAIESDDSPLDSAMRAIRRARAFGGAELAQAASARAAARLGVSNEAVDESDEDSPMGSTLRAVRRARAFGGVGAEAQPVAAQSEPCGTLGEDEAGDMSPLDTAMRAIRRARAFGGPEAASGAIAHAEQLLQGVAA